MHRIPTNLIEQVETFTTIHKPDEVVRVRNGKLVAGKFRGTAPQQFSGLLFKVLVPPCHWKKELFQKQNSLFEETSKKEERAFANALVYKISNRTNTPNNLRDSLNIADCDALLSFSEAGRKQFDTLVYQITNSMLSTSAAVKDRVDDAKSIAARAINVQGLCHIAQVNELRIEVNNILAKNKVDPHSIEDLDLALDEQTIKLALYNQAKEYALGISLSEAGNKNQSKKKIIEQTITRLDDNYPSLAGSVFMINELTTHIAHFLSDRKVEPVDAMPVTHTLSSPYVPFRSDKPSNDTDDS